SHALNCYPTRRSSDLIARAGPPVELRPRRRGTRAMGRAARATDRARAPAPPSRATRAGAGAPPERTALTPGVHRGRGALRPGHPEADPRLGPAPHRTGPLHGAQIRRGAD